MSGVLGSATWGWTIEADEPVEPVESGVLGGLSLDDKAALTGGATIWSTVGIDHASVPALLLTDGPAGARGTRFTGETSVCVPSATALAATWDRDIVGAVGRLLGDEARAKGAHVLLAPTVNLHRHPLGGRNFECFSEDPYLTAELAVAYIRGVQARGVGCAVKHLVANDQEHDRMEVSVEVDERTLREVYLQPFEAAVREAGVWAVMAAYNRLNGVHCSEHVGLLEGILRGEWGFDGLVVSDWYGTHSTAAVAAGLDLEMPGPPRFLGNYLAAAVRQGDVPEPILDRAAARLLGLVDRVTMATPDSAPPEDSGDLCRRAAAEAIVLLANDGVLPLDPTRSPTIAVLGPKAHRPDIQGGGSAHVDPPYVVTPLDGITRRATRDSADVRILHEPGVASRAPEPLGQELRTPDGASPGLLVEYFAGSDATETAATSEVVPRTRLFWLGPPAPGLVDDLLIRGTADFLPDRSGTWTFGLSSIGPSRVLIDGEVVVDNTDPVRGDTFFGRGSTEVEGSAELTAGQAYELEIELNAQARGATWLNGLNLTAGAPQDTGALERAVAAATEADVALVLVGGDLPDSEGNDRRDIDLPAEQVELIRAVCAANPSTVVLVDSGAPMRMDWADSAAAVAQLWYLGQEAGGGLADVLFGDTDAAGRLPTTLPVGIEDTPAFPFYPGSYGRTRYGEGVLVGHRHYDAHSIEPRFCFGHGLSYTEFSYGELVVDMNGTGYPSVSIDVTNVGSRPGREVVQLYVRDVVSSVTRPERELKEFAKLSLDPGETRTVRFDLPRRAFAFWDVSHHNWFVEPGEFEIAVGSSSRHIRATASVELPGFV